MRAVAFATIGVLLLLANGVASGQDRGAPPTNQATQSTPQASPPAPPTGHSLRLPNWLGGSWLGGDGDEKKATRPTATPLPRPQPEPLRFPEEPPIRISGLMMQSRQEDAATLHLIFGDVEITQGDRRWTGRRVVVWNFAAGTAAPAGRSRIEFVFDDDAIQHTPAGNRPAHGELFTLSSSRPPEIAVRDTDAKIGPDDPTVKRASNVRAVAPTRRTARPLPPPTPVRTVQSPGSVPPSGVVPSLPGPPSLPSPFAPTGPQSLPFGATPFAPPGLITGSGQRIAITPRSFEVPFVLESRPNLGSMPPEQIITVTRGVNIVIERPADGEVLDLTADSAVIWTAAGAGGGGSLGFDLDLTPDTPFQVYLRGDIVLRTGGTIARANEAFYDRAEGRGLLLGTEVRQYVPALLGDLRVQAESVRFEITNPNLAGLGPTDLNLRASNAWVSASRFGEPTYRLEASDIVLDNRPTGRAVDPVTGAVRPTSQPWITSRDNRFLLGDVPLAAAPEVSFPAEEFTIPVRRLNVNADRTFGVQFESLISLDDLFNLDTPPGTRLDLNLNYLTARGPQIGPEWGYRFAHDAFGLPAFSYGRGESMFVWDDGEDRLGLGRRDLDPVRQARGYLDVKHRSLFPNGWIATVEGGYASDRNVLEQYNERLWDQGKDLETRIEVKNVTDNLSVSALLQPQVNDFFNNTQWLPRADLTLLGQPLLPYDLPVSPLWSTHSMIGYGSINRTDPLPFGAAELAQNPAEVLTPLPYFPESSGLVAMTRHELSLPLDLGPARIAPYLLGDVLYQQEAIDGDSRTRLFGAIGIRGSTTLTRIDRSVRNDILGLDGLAHKMTFDFDYSIAESNVGYDELAQYNAFDDDAQERFRERLAILSFGGVLPAIADPRGYAVRSGAGRSVTAPYSELVDDLHVLRLGWRHRWQTKAGPPQNRRIRDWMTLDLEASIFPEGEDFSAEENFGETYGLLSARYAWNVGERTTILADSVFDPFAGGQETWSVGFLSQRSQRGSLYVGYRSIAIDSLDSDIVTVAASYAMSPKWIAVASASYDVAQGEGRGQTLQLTRLGRDFLTTYGLRYDASKNDFGIGIQIEPLIGPRDGRNVAPLLQRRPTQFGPLR